MDEPTIIICGNFSKVGEVAPMDMIIAVGFGLACVKRGRKVIWQEKNDDEDFRSLSEFEAMAKADNKRKHDWRVILDAPLSYREYQRQGDDKWVLIRTGQGFA